MIPRNLKERWLHTTAIAAVATAAFSSWAVMPSYAQDTDEGAAAEDQDVIVVTGTRIARPDLVANSPVTVVDSQELSITGTVNTEQLLNTLPQTIPGATTSSNNPSFGGAATVDLRGLSPVRTLVLVDGRRFVPVEAGGTVDINNIPPALIERVEVVTGGASAVYGSDAMAGAVNFILKDDFEGVQLDSNFTITEQGDGETADFSLIVGGNFADGKGNALVQAGYTNRSALTQGDRDFTFFTVDEEDVCPDDPILDDFGDGAVVRPAPTSCGSPLIPGLTRQGSAFNHLGLLIPLFSAFEFQDPGDDGILGALPGPDGILGTDDDILDDEFTSFAFSFDPGPDGITGTDDDVYSNDGVFEPNGDIRPFAGTPDEFNYAPFNFLQLPEERWHMNAKARYEHNRWLRAKLRTTFINTQVAQQLAPTPVTDLLQGKHALTWVVNTNNPFLSSQAQSQLQFLDANESVFDPGIDGILGTADDELLNPGAQGDGFINTIVARRFLEAPPRFSKVDANTYQIVGELGGDIPDFGSILTDWRWNSFYQYGFSSRTEVQNGNVDLPAFQQAILVVDAGPDGDPSTPDEVGNPDHFQCLDPSGGCIPLNIFGEGNLNTIPGATSFVLRDALLEAKREQTVFGADFTGSFLTMPMATSPIGMAFGTEYREENASTVPDSFLSSEDIGGFNTGPPTKGRFDVTEFFFETIIPLVQDRRFAERLEFEAGYRFSSYSNLDEGVDTYKFGGRYSPFGGLQFRGMYQRAVRAPNIAELFTAQSNNFPGAKDPCAAGPEGGFDDLDASQQAAVTPVCIATGVPAANVGGAIQATNQLTATAGGNPNLGVETADSWTVGAVIQPPWIENLTMQVDYYNITITDVIAAFGGSAQNVLDICYLQLADPGSAFCNVITRAGDGRIIDIELLAQNAAVLATEGIDLQIDYTLDLVQWDIPGLVNWHFVGTWVEENKFQANELSSVNDCAGAYGQTCGEPDPRFRFNHRVSYVVGPFTLSVRHRWLDAVRDDRIELNAGNPPVVAPIAGIKSHNYVDVSAVWNVHDHFQATFGVQNVTGNDAPVVPDISAEQSNTHPATYETLGRQFFLRGVFRM